MADAVKKMEKREYSPHEKYMKEALKQAKRQRR